MAQREQLTDEQIRTSGSYLGYTFDRAKDANLEHLNHSFNCELCQERIQELNEDLWKAFAETKKWKKRYKALKKSA